MSGPLQKPPSGRSHFSPERSYPRRARSHSRPGRSYSRRPRSYSATVEKLLFMPEKLLSALEKLLFAAEKLVDAPEKLLFGREKSLSGLEKLLATRAKLVTVGGEVGCDAREVGPDRPRVDRKDSRLVRDGSRYGAFRLRDPAKHAKHRKWMREDLGWRTTDENA